MSRSMKKFPGMSDGDCGKKFQKRAANKKVRHYRLWLPNGSTFKKLYDQWDICDHNFRRYSKEDMMKWCEKWADSWWARRLLGSDTEEDVKRVALKFYWEYVRK